jgi:hypothetical protein
LTKREAKRNNREKKLECFEPWPADVVFKKIVLSHCFLSFEGKKTK